MAILTGGQLLLAAFTLCGLLLTIILSLRSNRQTDELIDSESRFQRQQLRAYLSIAKWSAERDGNKVCVSTHITNRGQTPAKNVKVRRLADIRIGMPNTYDWTDIPEHLGDPLFFGIVDPAQELKPSVTSKALNPSDWLGIGTKKFRIAAQIEITYEDIFGGKYVRRAHMTFTESALDKQYPPPSGNDEDVLIDLNTTKPRLGLLDELKKTFSNSDNLSPKANSDH